MAATRTDLDQEAAVGTIVATPAAIDAIMHLRASHGTVALHQSGERGDEGGPTSLDEADLPIGAGDIQIGVVGGIPFLIDWELYESWGWPNLVVDVDPGPASRSQRGDEHRLDRVEPILRLFEDDASR